MTNVQQGFEARRGEVLRSDAAGVHVVHYTARLLVAGTGEVAIPVAFPCTFVEVPSVLFGAELEENASPVTGFFPTISSVVSSWVREEKLPGIFNYKGATVAVVTTNNPGNMWVCAQFVGKAFRNPVVP